MMILQAPGAGSALAAAATAFMIVVCMMVGVFYDARSLIGKRHKCVALGTGVTTARRLAPKEDHKRKHQAQADGKCEGNDRHDGAVV